MISSDFTIDYGAKTVTHTANTTVYTALEFFQWLAAEFASQSQMDDDYAFVSDTPTVYRWVNSWDMGNETSYEYLSGGSVETSDSQILFSNLYSIGTQAAGTQIYVIQDGSKISPWWGNGAIDILVKVKDSGTLIDSGNVLVMAREWGDFFDHNYADLSGGGRNPVGVNTATDINNDSVDTDVSAYGISIGSWGTYNNDLNNGAGAQDYDVEIDCNSLTMKEVFEFLKYRTRHTATDPSINGYDGEQYLSASTGYTDVKVAPFGTLAGTTFYGARGVWLNNYASADFVLIDSTGSQQSPPNYQKVTVSHDDLQNCQIFVTEVSSGEVWKNPYTIASIDASAVLLTSDLDINKVPQSGNFRQGDDPFNYVSYDGSAFLGVTPDPVGLSGAVYVPLLDTSAAVASTSVLSENIIYGSAFDVRAVVRKYGYKPFTQNTTFGSNGLTVLPVLADDPQAT